MLHHLGFGAVVAAHIGQPAVVARAAVDALGRARDAARQRQRKLRAKAGREVDGVLHRVAPAATQRQRAQLGVGLFQVRHRRNNAMLKDLERDHIFNADAHRVAGEAFGVRHHDLAGGRAKGSAQRGHLGRGAAAARGREGLVRDEYGLRGNRAPVDAEAALGGGDQLVHHVGDMVDIQAGAVEGAVARFAAQQLDYAAHATLAHRVFAFDHQRACAHAQDRAVAAAVERQRGLGHAVVGGSGAGGQEARADPLHQPLASDVVGGNHQHAPAASVSHPVFGQCNRLRGAGTGRIHVGVRAARADILGELAVAHRQNAEDKAPVEFIGRALQLLAQRANPARQLGQRGRVAGVAAQVFERGKLRAAAFPLVVALELVGHAVEAGEGAGENHASFIAQGLGQQPALGQEGAQAGLLIRLHQRDARFAQRVEAGGDCELGGDVECFDQLGRHAILAAQVECARARGQLDHVVRIGERFKTAATVFALHQPRDALGEHVGAEALGDQVDELLAMQDAQGVVGVHHRLFRARQAQARAADHH